MDLLVEKVTEDAIIPNYATPESAGLDLHANDSGIVWNQNDVRLVPTGIKMAIPFGYVGLIRPRSGLSTKRKVDVTAGVIDSDYRGEIMVALVNNGDRPFTYEKGDRIAQLLIMPIGKVRGFSVVQKLMETARGDSGFGSTGQ